MKKLLFVALPSALSMPLWAQTPAPPSLWSGTAAGGYIRTSGNANTSAANIKGELDLNAAPWTNILTGAAMSGRSNGTTTEERYSAGDKLKFNFNELDYAFANITYDNDRFAGIQQNYVESAGYGRRLYQTEKQTLDTEIGVGASEEKLADQTIYNADGTTTVTPGKYKVQPIVTFGGKYQYHFTANSVFTQTLRSEFGSDNTFINPLSELKLTIVGHLYATLNYEVRYNTTVPQGTYHTDIITSVNFGYGFGGKKP